MSSYQVIARKWRPQALHQLVGQEHIFNSLKNAIQTERIAHAYLFSGPRGVGKTSAARILAKSLSCEQGPGENPCQKCSNCIEITRGSSYDVLEIDGASNRGIDQIRELRDSVKYLPNKSRYKIFIIDEVHMLTDQAFNALLKTLEEPPAHIIFIFATTEPHKVKITIRSRCQHYHFKRIPRALIQQHLAKIAATEGITAEEQALFQIAKAGDGSMRDSQSLLDQVIAYSGNELTVKQVEEILDVFSDEFYIRFLTLLCQKDIVGLLTFLSSLIEAGEDLFHFSFGLIELFRNILIIKKAGSKQSKLLDIPDELIQELEKHIDNFSDEQTLEIINLLVDLNKELKKTVNQHYLFESCLFRLVNYENFIQPVVLLKKIAQLEQNILTANPDLEIEEIKVKKPLALAEETRPQAKTSSEQNSDQSSQNENQSINLPDNFWSIFTSSVKKEKKMFLATYLENSSQHKVVDGVLHIVFEEKPVYDVVSNKEDVMFMEEIFAKTFKRKLKFKMVLQPKVEQDHNDPNHRQEMISNTLKSFEGEVVSGEL